MKRPKILVVGSLVMDLIVSGESIPEAGETRMGRTFSMLPGGKGANQAVQAARLGAEVTMFGKVGDDDFGKRLIASVEKSGVNTDHISITHAAPTAIGNVWIQNHAAGTENRILVVPGANMDIAPGDVETLKETIADFDIVILQNEIPMEINVILARYAQAADVPVMLNPAPAAEIPAQLISCLTYLSPNEQETQALVGIKPEGEECCKAAADKLLQMGVKNVLITLGKHGCVFHDGESMIRSGSIDCGRVVDPTAAGDSFIGAFSTAITAGVSIREALLFANCTAGITVTRLGAQASLPDFQEVIHIMKEKGYDVNPYLYGENGFTEKVYSN